MSALGVLGWVIVAALAVVILGSAFIFLSAVAWAAREAARTPTNTPPSAVTRDSALGGATTSVPSSFGEGSGGTEASAARPAPGTDRDGT